WSVFKADGSSRRDICDRRHLSDRSWPDQHQPGAVGEILGDPHREHLDPYGGSQRDIISTGVILSANDEQFRPVCCAVLVSCLERGRFRGESASPVSPITTPQ